MPSDMSAQRRFWPACTLALSDQIQRPGCISNSKDAKFPLAENENSDHTPRMCRLISVFVGRASKSTFSDVVTLFH